MGGAVSRAVGDSVFPIKSLNPYQNKWAIVGRVTSKKEIKTYSNQRGDGKLFSFDLLDNQGGEIKVTSFNAECDRFFPIVQEGAVYKVSRGSIKSANRRYSSLNSQFEITLDQTSTVEPMSDTQSIPANHFNFCNLSNLEECSPETNVDVIGIAHVIGDVAQIKTRAGKDLDKREIQLVDFSGQVVKLTLWGQQAESFRGTGDAVVVAVKAARVSDFDGRSLSVSLNSSFSVNPPIPETQQLLSWYHSQGPNLELKHFQSQRVHDRKVLRAVQDENMGLDVKPSLLQAKVTISMVNHKNKISYPSCPKCKKKVIDDEAGQWRCDKCATTLAEPIWRYLLSMQCKDHTTSQWVSLFDEVATLLLGKTASEMRDLQQFNEDEFENVFDRCAFTTHLISLRVKSEPYGDEQRLRLSATAITPLDYVVESHRLLKEIHEP
eukprot:c6220_g1_i1.p1 GENE.c6220_g1_i1~~c6220_g1_i1.p1  ORF type:complete len:492 (-),score=113.07 c6220_g1_i1:188-1495(-)